MEDFELQKKSFAVDTAEDQNVRHVQGFPRYSSRAAKNAVTLRTSRIGLMKLRNLKSRTWNFLQI
jgi:hypothetical protein